MSEVTDVTRDGPRAPQPGAEGLAEPLRSRWSPSVYDDEHTLTRDEIELLLTAAQWSPSSGNTQPWVLFVCERGSATHDLLVPRLSRGNSGWVPRASLVLVTAAQIRTGAEPGAEVYSPYARYDVGQAAAHVTLQARMMGLHAHQFAGFDHDGLAADLRLPATHALLTGIAVGVLGDPSEVDERTAARDHRDRVRRGLDEIARAGTWDEPWVERS